MGFFDFFRKKKEIENYPRTIQNEVQDCEKRQININDIAYSEIEPSKATCDGIVTTPIPNKSIAITKPKRMKFTKLSMHFFKKNV